MENKEKEKLFKQIEEKLVNLKYGSITIVVQDGKVIQIETSEKIRLK